MHHTPKAYYAGKLDIIEKRLRLVNGRALRRKERKLERKVQIEADKQKKVLIKKLRGIYERFSKEFLKTFGTSKKRGDLIWESKTLSSEIDDVFDDLSDAAMIGVVIEASAETMEFGAKYRINKMKLGRFGISFALSNERASEYLESTRPLELSKMKDTTKEHIKPLLLKAQEQGLSYSEVAKQISDNHAFSRVRSQMIATNEIGHAYEFGNKVPMLEMQDQGFDVKKQWLTAGDNKVTPECADYSDMGEIPLDKAFISSSGTEDDEAPRDSNPHCRCTTLYDFDD